MTRPLDQDVRDTATTALDTSIALNAGAASGKTTVLTQRVLGLLLSGVPPERIAAITFTEKATSELIERLRDGLERAALDDPDHPHASNALARFGALGVSTIHSFCRELLTLESLAAAWAPGTEMLSRSSAPVAVAWRTWLHGFHDRHPAVAPLVRLVVGTGTLRTAAGALVTFRDLRPHPAAPVDVRAVHGQIVALRDRARVAVQACKVPQSDTLVVKNQALLQALEHAAGADADQAVAAVLLDLPDGTLQGGQAKDWHPPGKAPLVQVVRDARALKTRVAADLHGLVVGDLHQHFLPAVAQAKADAALADFDDLLFRARDLLAHDPAARARLARRYSALLIDEVQDTDPIQAEVAALLARAPEHSGVWHTQGPRPGHLFAVGDPRQSIYRFRRADVAVWQRLVDLIARDGQDLALVQNFRSVPGLVAWVNHTFRDLAGYRAQAPSRGPAALPPVVALPLRLPDDAGPLTKPQAAALLAPLERQAIARALLHLRHQGRVTDRQTGALRPVRWSDVMVLGPTWRPAHDLAHELARYGIPAVVEGGSTFFDRPEITTLMAALRALIDPADLEATVQILRDLFGLTLQHLAQHKANGGTFRHTVPDPPAGPVADALTILSALHRRRGQDTLVALLDGLLEHTRTRAVWALMPDRDARLANLDRFEARLREAEAQARHPAEAVALLRAQSDDSDESEQPRGDSDLDAVRLTTVFSAKGLESPIVVLAGNRRSNSSFIAARDPDGVHLALKVGNLEPPSWDQHKERERAALTEERHRWMYVAATRARDLLLIPVWPTEHTGSTDLTHQFLTPGLPGVAQAEHGDTVDVAEGVHLHVWRPEALPPVVPHDGPFGHLTHTAHAALQAVHADDDAPGDVPADQVAWSHARVQAVQRATEQSVTWRTVTELAHTETVERATGIGAVGGDLMHAVMDNLDLQAPDLPEAARAELHLLAAEQGVPDALVADVQRVLDGILAHPVWAEIRTAPEVWREVPFGIEDKGRQVHGVIDCAFPVDAERKVWRVVDWKSDAPEVGSAAWRNYERQLGWYAKAVLATVTGCEGVGVVLVGGNGSCEEDENE